MYRSSLMYVYFQANKAVSDAQNESGLLVRRSAIVASLRQHFGIVMGLLNLLFELIMQHCALCSDFC